MNKYFYLVFFIILFSLLYSSLPTKNILASEIILFQDDFNQENGAALKWDTYNNLNWEVRSEEYGITINSSQPVVTNTFPKDIYWDYNWKNIVYELDIRGKQGTDKNILIKYQSPSRFIELHHTGGNLVVDKAGTGKLASIKYPLYNEQTYHIKIEIDGDDINVYIDDMDNPVIVTSDNVGYRFDDWKIGLRAGTGAVTNTEVWFDNIVIKQLLKNNKTLNLPFHYQGRGEYDGEAFREAFNNRVTAYFDHDPSAETYIPYNGIIYYEKCNSGNSLPIECYNGHNGVDFSKIGGEDVLAADEGTVVYASSTKETEDFENKCIKDKKGYGCVVIIKHENNLHTLYAHMKEIYAVEGEHVSSDSVIGKMGSTGNSTGTHLHFSAFYKQPEVGIKSFYTMNEKEWLELAEKSVGEEKKDNAQYKVIDAGESRCTYISYNGLTFNFVDPSGWEAEYQDPWASQDGCGQENAGLWKFSID